MLTILDVLGRAESHFKNRLSIGFFFMLLFADKLVAVDRVKSKSKVLFIN